MRVDSSTLRRAAMLFTCLATLASAQCARLTPVVPSNGDICDPAGCIEIYIASVAFLGSAGSLTSISPITTGPFFPVCPSYNGYTPPPSQALQIVNQDVLTVVVVTHHVRLGLIGGVRVSFDLNGDGAFSTGEQLNLTPGSPNPTGGLGGQGCLQGTQNAFTLSWSASIQLPPNFARQGTIRVGYGQLGPPSPTATNFWGDVNDFRYVNPTGIELWQVNTTCASLVVNGVSATPYSPAVVINPPGGAISLDLAGSLHGNLHQIYVDVGSAVPLGGGGLIFLATNDIVNLNIISPGVVPFYPTPVPFCPDTLNATLPAGLTLALQMVITDTSSANGLRLSQAVEIRT